MSQTKKDSLEELLQEMQEERERDMRIRIQNEREDRERTWPSGEVYLRSDPRVTKIENGALEKQDFLVLSSLPRSLEPTSSLMHSRGIPFATNDKRESRQNQGGADSSFVGLPEETHLKLAIENFLYMMKKE